MSGNKSIKVDVLVLGAGIIGVSTAYHLQQKGKNVALIDRQAAGHGTSYGNAGLIERSSVIPYSFPRSFRAILNYSTNRQAAMRYDISYLPKIAPWLFRFWRQSSKANLTKATQALLPLIEQSVNEHDKMIEAAQLQHLRCERGWIEIFRDPQSFMLAKNDLNALTPYHLTYDVLEGKALNMREPALHNKLAGGIHWLDPKTVTSPGALVQGYCNYFVQSGGIFTQADARSLRKTETGWTVDSLQGVIESEHVVVSLGWESLDVLAPFGLKNIPLAVKRGYHMHYQPTTDGALTHSVCDTIGGFVLAPMEKGIRLTTGIEFASPTAPANEIQLKRAEKIAKHYFNLGERVESEIWLGHRPCLPDMCPIIGPVPSLRGLWLNFGHAHHGLTLGPVSGRLLSELMNNEKPFTSAAPFSIERFL